jgi:effector-binding domain-containing protein
VRIDYRKLPEVIEELKMYEDLPETNPHKKAGLFDIGTNIMISVKVTDPELFRSVYYSAPDNKINTALSIPGAEIRHILRDFPKAMEHVIKVEVTKAVVKIEKEISSEDLSRSYSWM